MRKSIVSGVLLTMAVSLLLYAVVPRRFELRTQEDFLKGKFILEITSNGWDTKPSNLRFNP